MSKKLPAEWRMARLGDVCRVVPGYAFSSEDWQEDGIPVIKIKNIQADCRIDLSETDCVPESLLTPKLEKFALKDADILVAMTGATAGKVGKLRTNRVVLLNQRVAKIEPFAADENYIWSVVSSQDYQSRFFNLADGAAQPNMSGTQIEGVEIPLPPSPAQTRIGGVLCAYDDLIENNTRRVQILEQMARDMYREWFVDFRFHGHEEGKLVQSPIGEIPQGWEVKRLDEVASLCRGKSYRSSELVEHDGLPFVNLKCIKRGGGFRVDGLKWFSGEFKETNKCQTGDIVVAVTDMTQERRLVAHAARVPRLPSEFGVMSMDLVRVAPRCGMQAGFLHGLLRFSDFSPSVSQHANGVNVLHLSPSLIEAYQFACPPPELARQYSEASDSLFGLADVLAAKTAILRRTHDLLLPNLMSGALDVSKLDIETA